VEQERENEYTFSMVSGDVAKTAIMRNLNKSFE